jgi:hypothetical protein
MRPTDTGPDRRSLLLLGAGAGAAVLTGCSLNNPFDTTRTPAAKAVRDLAPDVGIAVQAVALISAAQQELETLVAGRATNAATMSALVAAYQAYADALRGAVPKGVDVTGSPGPSSTPAPIAPSPTTNVAVTVAARRTATTLHARLTGFALRAESGSFARLLGTMAAGLSQQLVVLAR